MTIAQDFDYFDEKYDKPSQQVTVPEDTLETLAAHLPPVLIEYYQRYGFSTFLGGYFQLVNPITYAPTLRKWIKDTPLMEEDEYFVISMTCMGNMNVWGKKFGRRFVTSTWQDGILLNSFTDEKKIAAGKGNISAEDLMFEVRYKESTITTRFFKEAMATHGAPGIDQMFGLTPALPLGGTLAAENLGLVSAPEYLSMLADLAPKPILTTADLAKRAFGPT
ncbi:DUF1851 domain-containing protein [Alphaproteobacteria bacterium KMM 3653]|uniref:DUF1851 domain-containing protein n=1 Tax=Harenicola maris TaxID=2841044 RepID=A0AAP2CLU3_9RHOB|nr:DUF1851 domain-containing protein [Harenicola maris]